MKTTKEEEEEEEEKRQEGLWAAALASTARPLPRPV